MPTPPPTAKSPQACLIGVWLQTSYVTTAKIYGVDVQLRGKGTVLQVDSETWTNKSDKVVVSGTADGKRYDVVFDSTITTNYKADDTTIHFSNPRVKGTTTWKVNGKVTDSEPTTVLLRSNTYHCSGDELRLYAEEYASEWKRVHPPGVPV